MYNIRLADGAFVFSFRDVDEYVIKETSLRDM